MSHPTDDTLRSCLQPCSLAVLGAKDASGEAAFYVPDYLHRVGFTPFAVNPKLVGQSFWGNPAVARLADLPGPVDGLDVFRRPDLLDAHVDEIAALPWRPRFVWFQLGIRNDGAAARLGAMGITVVQDRCMMPEHRRLMRS
jgi:uncharacterized protein